MGDVVTVSGELGAGKTTFVRGACRALGVTAPVTSPTFTIGHRYSGIVDVSHLDLYRFVEVSVAEWGDLEPYFDDAVVFVEWPEAGVLALPSPRVAVSLEHAGDDRRRIVARIVRDRAATRHLLMLVLAFDTATDVATSALVLDGRVLGERTGSARALLGDVDDLLASAGATPAGPRRARRRHGAGKLHEHADRSRVRARARRWRSRFREPACRRSTRSLPGSPARFRSSTLAGRRCSSPGRAPSRPTTSISSRGRSASATAPSAIARRSSASAPSCLPTRTSATSRTRGSTRRSRATTPTSSASSRSTSGCPMRSVPRT